MRHFGPHRLVSCHRTPSAAVTLLLVALAGCGDPAGPVDPTGRVVFWTDQALLVPIAVQLGSEPVEVITTPFSTTPACGQSGVANYTVNEGSYSVVAADAGSHRWTNSVSVTKGMCLAVRLYSTASRTLVFDAQVVSEPR